MPIRIGEDAEHEPVPQYSLTLPGFDAIIAAETLGCMGKTKQPRPVKLICSMFSGNETLLAGAREALGRRFGPLDYQSQVLPFDHTSYYAPEFGQDLKRQIVAFSGLIPPDSLAEIKLITNAMEMTWTQQGRRQVNLDPGYLSLGKLVLATTKDFSHRIYLGQGIYAEVTLHYRHGAFEPWDWTYPDYASPIYRSICGEIRAIYANQLREAVPA
jgi:hypothetical protein